MSTFSPEDMTSCASECESYKRRFEIHLDAKGLHADEGRRKVATLLECMGGDHFGFATYDTFHFVPAVLAVPANADAEPPIAGVDAVLGEDRYNLKTVFLKFDAPPPPLSRHKETRISQLQTGSEPVSAGIYCRAQADGQAL